MTEGQLKMEGQEQFKFGAHVRLVSNLPRELIRPILQ